MPKPKDIEATQDLRRDMNSMGRRQAAQARGAVSLGWYRGQHQGWIDSVEWLKRNGHKDATKALQRHYGMNAKGAIVL